jgi:endonuclease G
MRYLSLIFILFSSSALADIKSLHCPLGCPSLEISGNDLMFGHIYALSQNPSTMFADWVAYEVDVRNFGLSPNRTWKNNPTLDESMVLEPNDYSGIQADLSSDRGHQAPLGSFSSSLYWPETNYLSNITPQKGKLNKGAWKHLESAVRSAVNYKSSLFVITGTLYESNQKPLQNSDEKHVIPSGYYKIIYDKSGKAATFIMHQNTKGNYCKTRTTLSTLKSKLKYSLPDLKDSNEIAKRLGCE